VAWHPKAIQTFLGVKYSHPWIGPPEDRGVPDPGYNGTNFQLAGSRNFASLCTRRPGPVPHHTGFPGSTHDSSLADPLSPGVEFTVNRFQMFSRYMRIYLRRNDIGVPQEDLNAAKIRAPFQKVGGEAVAEGVGVDRR